MHRPTALALGFLTCAATAFTAVAQQTHTGTLNAEDPQLPQGEYYDLTPLELEQGQRLQVDLASDAFNPYLIVLAPNGQQFDNDDFEGSSQHARLTLGIDQTGQYTVIVTSQVSQETGAYTLTITGAGGPAEQAEAPKPPAEDRLPNRGLQPQTQPHQPQEQPQPQAIPPDDHGPLIAARGMPETLELRPHIITDPHENQMPAYRVLAPEGWEVESEIAWNINAFNQSFSMIQVINPHNSEAVVYYPLDSYIQVVQNAWTFVQEGQRYLGNMVRTAPQSPADYIQRDLFPFAEPGANPRIIDTENYPEISRMIERLVHEQGLQKRAITQRVRVAHRYNGQPVEEDIYTCIVYTQGFDGSVYWTPVLMVGLRADQGQLDNATEVLTNISNTLRMEPNYYGYVQYVRQLFFLRLQNQLQQAQQLSDMYRQNSEEIFRMHQESYEYRQQTMDSINDNFTHYLRDTAVFTNPQTGQQVVLPNTHSHVYQTANGTYVGTNNPNDPRIQQAVNSGAYTPVQSSP